MKTSYGLKLLPYLRPYRLRFLWALAQVFLIAGFELLKPWPLQVVIDNVLSGEEPRFPCSRSYRAEKNSRRRCLLA